MPRNLTQPVMLALCALGACQERAPSTSDHVALYLDGSGERRIRMRDVAIEPASNVLSARLDVRGGIAIERADRSSSLRVSLPGMCPVNVAPGPHAAALAIAPALELGGDRTGIGFATRFSVQARHNCSEQGRGEITWRQLEGPALAELQVTDAGFQLSARTASFAEAHPEPALSQGIIPISPRTQARVVLEASWQAPGQPVATRTLTITAAARSSGLSSVAVSQPIVLAGTGWRVDKRPPGAHASVQAQDGLTFFRADAPGSWSLSQHEQHTLKLQSLSHDATPYDCGRAECHAALSQQTAESPMSHALERPLGAVQDSAAVSCMLDCHVLGERGLNDGGFRAVSARLGFTWNEHTRWQDLPQALRRAGGVRCTACHGPGAIPPPQQRSAILESDVCATCHDAPPRYVHVAQWRSGKMATSDRDLATREAPCARCHTTAGFLAHAGVRKLTEETARAEPTGIACAACHAPHSAERGPRLLRHVEAEAALDELFPEASVALCRSCHTSSSAASAAPSGTLWTSSLPIPALQGEAWDRVQTRSPHQQVPRGCITCHGAGAREAGPIDHSFRANKSACATCHSDDALQSGRDAQQLLRARALALSQALAPHCQSEARSAHPQLDTTHCSNKSLERANYEVNLVLDDAAAIFHNADLSRALLADAERQLNDHDHL